MDAHFISYQNLLSLAAVSTRDGVPRFRFRDARAQQVPEVPAGQLIKQGTGLGLSIVMGILRDHNAEVEVESEEGVGTEFIIRFPL